jgi:hypothetical protein
VYLYIDRQRHHHRQANQQPLSFVCSLPLSMHPRLLPAPCCVGNFHRSSGLTFCLLQEILPFFLFLVRIICLVSQSPDCVHVETIETTFENDVEHTESCPVKGPTFRAKTVTDSSTMFIWRQRRRRQTCPTGPLEKGTCCGFQAQPRAEPGRPMVLVVPLETRQTWNPSTSPPQVILSCHEHKQRCHATRK